MRKRVKSFHVRGDFLINRSVNAEGVALEEDERDTEASGEKTEESGDDESEVIAFLSDAVSGAREGMRVVDLA